MANNHRQSWGERTEASRCQMKGVDVLPDEVLLGIFDFYMDLDKNPLPKSKTTIEAWQSLVHVCRRWRNLAFDSPRRLNLRLYCTPKTPARDTLDVWPAIPLIISGIMRFSGLENVIAALERSNRVSHVALLDLAGWQLEKVLAAMQVPFPALTDLQFSSNDKTVPVIPDFDSFLAGSAPRLQCFSWKGIPFPGLPKLLSSANHLVSLFLINIPHSGYIPPGAMVALLSVLPNLRTFHLEFESPQSLPDLESRSLPPPKPLILPALDFFQFKGVTEYLEDLVTPIDAPHLTCIYITFFNQIDFDIPRLAQFINRTCVLEIPSAAVTFGYRSASVRLISSSKPRQIQVSCKEPDWQLSFIEQVCNSSLHPLSTLQDLYIELHSSRLVWKNVTIENTRWLGFLLPFTAVKNLYLSNKELVQCIAAALQELVGGRITEVLPGLQNIFVEGLEQSEHFRETFAQFVAARQLSGHPVTISV